MFAGERSNEGVCYHSLFEVGDDCLGARAFDPKAPFFGSPPLTRFVKCRDIMCHRRGKRDLITGLKYSVAIFVEFDRKIGF